MSPIRFRLSFNMTLDEQVEDLLRAWRVSGVVAAQRKSIIVGTVFIILLSSLYWMDREAAVIGIIFGVVFFVSMFGSINRRLRRQARWTLHKFQGTDAPLDMAVELTDADAILRRPDHDQVWHWSGIRSVSEDQDALRLLTARYSIISLPKRAFRNVREEEECLAFMRQKLSMNGSPQH